MTDFRAPASDYMTSPIVTLAGTALAFEAEALLGKIDVTALGVTDAAGALIGVLSRTDLLVASSGESGETFSIPDVTVSTLMSPDPASVTVDTPMHRVAAMMVDNGYHRIFVERDGEAVGVVSTQDMMRLVLDAQVRTPAIEIATREVIHVNADDSLALAVERLDRSNKHGLLVLEDGWPVGTFGQLDALLARARDPRTPVDEVLQPRVLVLPPAIPLFRAAQQAITMGVRRLVLLDKAEVCGVVSAFDFCRFVAS